MRLPGRTDWDAVCAEEALSKHALAGSGRAAIECAQHEDETPATLPRQDRRRTDWFAQRMGPEQEDDREPLRRELVDRHKDGADGRVLTSIRSPELARVLTRQTMLAVIA